MHTIKIRSGKTRDRIIAHLKRHPGATSATLAEALGQPESNISASLSKLNKTGAVTRQKVGHHYAYMLAAPKPKPDVADVLDLGLFAAVPGPSEAELAEREELKRRLAELEAWKAEALAKHPDLIPIDYEAYREALAAFYGTAGWGSIAEDISNGAPLTAPERQRIDGLIAAAKHFPKEA